MPAALQAIAVYPPAPAVPWRDPHTVSPEALADIIRQLEEECCANPGSSDLRTCLGMAYAMNYQVHESMDALERAVEIDARNFWARFKYAELLYRLRALPRAEEETRGALELARDYGQVVLCRRQLQEIRRLMREGTQKTAWTRPLLGPVLAIVGLLAALSMTQGWR